jgi:hypothetical protein
MSDAHEKFLAELFDGERQRNSGAVWSRQMDVRNGNEGPFRFAIDGKASFNASIGVSRDMWDKAEEQSHDLRTALALRFYDDWHLTPGLDLIIVKADDFAELLGAARANQESRSTQSTEGRAGEGNPDPYPSHEA